MKDAKLFEFASKPSHESLGHVLSRIHGKNGLLEQARKAQAGGTLGDFFKQLLATLGPMLGPIIMALLASLLHIPLPVPAN